MFPCLVRNLYNEDEEEEEDDQDEENEIEDDKDFKENDSEALSEVGWRVIDPRKKEL